jgi:hypothetical protein
MPRKAKTHNSKKSSSARSGRRRASRDGGSDVSDYRQKTRAGKLARGSGKGSCAPKLFMLLMPFAAAGTYPFLRS